MANVLVEEGSLTNIANAIREKNGTTTTYKPSEMATAISSIETGGGGSTPTQGLVINERDENGWPTDIAIVDRTTIPEYYCYYFGDSINNFFGRVEKITLPENLTTIGNYSFQNCTNWKIPELADTVTTIGNYAFSGCENITWEKLPNSLGPLSTYAFDGCKNLAITEIPSGMVTSGTYVFRGCSSIPHITWLGDVTTISRGLFYSCTGLSYIALPNVTNVPTLSGTNAFYNTPINSGTGYIYVPDNLVDSFKSASNWSTFADQILPISEMPTE